MPSPVGHLIAGVCVAIAASPSRSLSRSRLARDGITRLWPSGLALVAAAAPDLDLLFGSHRGPSHSLTLAIAAGVVVWFVVRRVAPSRALEAGILTAAAWASHVLLDSLGRDSSPPAGIMAWWPWSRVYVETGLDVFSEVSRRYWDPREFILGNLQSVAREIVILGPCVIVAWWWRHGRRGQYR